MRRHKAKKGIACPQCGHNNAVEAKFCVECGAPFRTGSAAPASFGDMPTVIGGTPPPPLMQRGAKLARGRYEILEILGQGGMGAVYKAKDHELDRWVAIKVIQPELVKSPAMLKRFKQELILARQVTHRNVVRIFDIGETDGMKFITMEYIDGSDLKSRVIERGKLPAEEAVGIVRQICYALDAAHSEGVVHRDLKPQNIMIDHAGRVVVMDFGIAHSKDLPGITMTGALLGTPDYMSPEQAKGEKTDARGDIFAVGIIFYEMLVGKVPFRADTVLETMYKRTRESATPPVDLDHSIPFQANHVVLRCLETAPENRYQNVREILQDLEAFDPAKKVSTIQRARSRKARRSVSAERDSAQLRVLKAAVIAALIVSILLAFLLLRNRTAGIGPPGQPQAKQVLVADFAASEPELAGTIEPILGLALEGASFIYNVDRARARATAKTLQPNANAFDENAARLVAVRDGIDVVISGSIGKRGSGYQLSAKAVEAAEGKLVATASVEAADKAAIPSALTKLASSLRTALGDTASDEVKRSDAETISTSSLEALRNYAQAQDLRSSGNWEEAIRYYRAALQIDSKLGRAYSGMAAAYANLGQAAEARRNFELALEQLDRMTEREKYRTRSVYYLFMRSTDKAIEEAKALVAQFPGDTGGYGNLALAYFQTRNFTEALVQGRQFTKIDPKNVTGLNNVALYLMYLGDFETAGREAAKVLAMNPSLIKGYLAAAMSELGQNRTEQAAAIYEKARAVSAAGASLAASGLADIALYQGRVEDAITVLEMGVAADIAANLSGAASDKLATQASVYSDINDTPHAISAANRALAAGQDESVLFRSALVFIRSHQTPKALPLIEKLRAKLQNDPQAYAKLLEAESLREQGRTRDAMNKIREASAIADSWIGHFELGRAYLEAHAFAEASSEFDICFKRRGEATAVFLDDRPTYHHLPDVLYYQARVQEGLKSPGALDKYNAFVAIKKNADKDPLALDARRRVK